MYDYVLRKLPEIPQHFYLRSSGQLLLVSAKVVDDILIAAPILRARSLVEHIRLQFKLGTIVKGLTCFEFYELEIEQQSDMMVSVSSPKKLTDISECSIDLDHRKQPDAKLNSAEIS